MSGTRQTLVERLGAAGLARPQLAVEEAANVGLPLAIALVLLEEASAGRDEEGSPRFGLNVFGDDPDSDNPIRGGFVTFERYEEYLEHRRAGRGMQGVGPMQVRWHAFQDLADRMGGCWEPRYSMRVGFAHAKALIVRDGLAEGGVLYLEAAGRPREQIGDWAAQRDKWSAWLAGGEA